MAPTPVEKSVELFNSVAALKLGDAEAARALQFQLGPELRRQPTDPQLQVAMAKACRIVGERDLALKHLQWADAQWSRASWATQGQIAGQWTQLGQAEKSLQRAKDLARNPDISGIAGMLVNIGMVAELCGDVDLLSEVAAMADDTNQPNFARQYLSTLKELELLACFPDLQKVMYEIVRNYAMQIEGGFYFHPEDGCPYLTWTVYIDGSKIHRWEVSDRLDEALGAYFLSTGHCVDDWWWRYSVLVTTAPRHSSIPGIPKPRFAA